MSVTETVHKETPLEPHHRAHEDDHPKDRTYVVLAIVLAIITAAEVWTHFWDEKDTTTLVAFLYPLMIAKFVIVAGWFMHLRYDNPLFRRVFIFGTILAISVYMIFLTAMQFFTDNWTLGT